MKKSQNFWIEKTIVKGREDREKGERSLGKVLWSPQVDRRGADIYKNMRRVEKGDIVLHLINNKEISGVSIVEKEFVETSGVSGTDWEGPSYLIELINYTELNPRINRGDILNVENRELLESVSQKSEVFYNNKLDLRQGAYLTPCPIELISLVNDYYNKKTNKNLPHVNIPKDMKNGFINFNEFNKDYFSESLEKAGLIYSSKFITRFVASLLTKPFVILTGLSGSGKTKLAQAFVEWICQSEKQYCIIPVGADWTNREPLLGYPNALEPDKYVKPDSGVLDLIIRANSSPELPYFLILDEMNLSHVERYFADFLSVMESDKEIPLYSGNTVGNGVEQKLNLPKNLFIIGTVNIDETTNMFSPKVLDRANTIEFRVEDTEMEYFLKNIKKINMEALKRQGASMGRSFIQLSENKSFTTEDLSSINDTLLLFFKELSKTGAEFGYRSASEILQLINQLSILDDNLRIEEKIDIAIMQKLLPKLHGSRGKLHDTLVTLGLFCLNEKEKEKVKIENDIFNNHDFNFNSTSVRYPLSLEKIARMYKGAIVNGFTSFAEA